MSVLGFQGVLPLSPFVSLCLPLSPCVSLCLPLSPFCSGRGSLWPGVQTIQAKTIEKPLKTNTHNEKKQKSIENNQNNQKNQCSGRLVGRFGRPVSSNIGLGGFVCYFQCFFLIMCMGFDWFPLWFLARAAVAPSVRAPREWAATF